MTLEQIFKTNKKWLIVSIILITACAEVEISTQPGGDGVEEIIPKPTVAIKNILNTSTAISLTEAQDSPDIEDTSLELLPNEAHPAGAENQFSTDFSKHTVPYSEILSGGPPKDSIPVIDDPKFTSVSEADEYLGELEPVIFFQIGEDVRAYPLQIMTWHEIVNDVVGGVPVSITFCPLCNTAIAFKRTLNDQELDFGTTGRLRFSNLIMYDRQTETWWQQATGEAIVGELTGTQLAFLPAAIVGWGEYKENFPNGQVLSRDTGFIRSYGSNPYTGYDNINNSPFAFRGPQTPRELPTMTRVLTIDLGDEAVAYPYGVFQEKNVVNDTVSGREIVVFWQPGTASALDSLRIAEGEDVGAAASFSREVDGQVLTFSFDGKKIVDDQSRSQWDVFGQAISGELSGTQLEPVISVNHFWFSWAAFKPETRIYQD